MNVFLAGTDVTLSLPLLDSDGNALAVETIEFRVTDEAGAEVLPRAALVEFIAESATVEIPVLAVNNTLGEGVTRGARFIELFCIVGGNTVVLNGGYVIQNVDRLAVGVNSFQTYPMAIYTATDMANLPGWDAASDDARRAALMEARHHINQLSFNALTSGNGWGQDNLNYVAEGTRDGFMTDSASLDSLTPAQFMQLPERFRKALCLAQIAEADVILGGDPIEKKRLEGLVADMVGESKQMFRPKTPLRLPVSRRALGYLSLWVSFAKKIGRG